MLRKSIRLLVIVTAIILITSPAWAAKGFRLGSGLGLGLPAFDGDAIDGIEPRGGFAWDMLDIGYGFTEAASVNFRIVGAGGVVDASGFEEDFEALTGVKVDADFTWAFAEYALDFRYAFMTDKNFNPFIMLGLGLLSGLVIEGDLSSAVGSVDVEITTDPAVGLDIGGGFQYYLGSKERWSLGTLLYFHLVEYSDATLEVENYGLDLNEEVDGGILMVLFTVSYTWRQ